MEQNESKNTLNKEVQEKKPNELGGVLIATSVKISDPNTKEILLQIRGD